MLTTRRWERIIVVAALVLILALVNWSIWSKERHLAEGEVVFLELAPVDPRSLMQGDYMALRFALANRVWSARYANQYAGSERDAADGYVIVRLDAQRVGHFERLGSPAATLAEDEMLLRYRLRNGQVQFATDAFFFQEGHAERYEPARYGQFRVNEKGEPLLVALHDAGLERLGNMER